MNTRNGARSSARRISSFSASKLPPRPCRRLNYMELARLSSNPGSQMLFRFYFFFQILLLASFSLPVSHAFAQREDMAIGDQPGLIPNPADEELPLQFRRQVVLPAGQWGRDRSLRPNSRRYQGYRPAEAGIVIMPCNLQQ